MSENKTSYKGGDDPMPIPIGNLVGREFRPWRPYIMEDVLHSGSLAKGKDKKWYKILRVEEHAEYGTQLLFLNDQNIEKKLSIANVGEWKEDFECATRNC